MDCILLCAGYATRMYPLTENFPKPLLEISGKPLIDYLIDDLVKNRLIDRFIVVSNHKFIEHFKKWKATRSENILLLDDGSTANENRLGAVKDIQFAIESALINSDVLVLAGDNLLDFSLSTFIEFAKEKNSNCVMRYYESDLTKLKRTGVAVVDENDLIISMVEKPENPQSNWAIPPFYVFGKEYLSEFKVGINGGCKVDAPGGFIEWFAKRNAVYAFKMPGSRIDIGSLEGYEKIKKSYKGII